MISQNNKENDEWKEKKSKQLYYNLNWRSNRALMKL